MTNLREVLELISGYLEQEIAYQVLNPGLSLEDIELEVRILPFNLPTEICELYMWRNGGSLEGLGASHFGRNIKSRGV
jgi:hypothetical protein